MWKVIPALLLCLFVNSTGVVAAEPEGRPPTLHLRVAASQQLARMIEVEKTHPPIWHAQDTGSQGTEPERGWIGRHPVLAGMLIGAGGGAVIGGVLGANECRGKAHCWDLFSPAEDAALMAAFGAGVGALTGLIVRLVR